MTSSILELRPDIRHSNDDLPSLRPISLSFAGEPFRFARISYGDELTLHFGDLRPPRSPKLKKPYGAYILGLRASAWVLKSVTESALVTSGPNPDMAALGKLLSKEEFERNPTIQPDSRVIAVTPFMVKPFDAFAVQIRFSEGSAFLAIPAPFGLAEPDDDTLPELADWELLSPLGLLSVGPGLQWSFKPSTDSKSVVHA